MRKPALQVLPDTAVVAHEIARLDEQIEEIQAPRLRLQKFIVGDRVLQCLMEERGEIGFARGDERLKLSTHAIAAGQHFVACQIAERRLRRSLMVPTFEAPPVPSKLTQFRFESVVVAASHRLETR